MKKSAISGMIWKFAERISARFVSFLVSIILARILIPEDYSVVAIVTIFFSLSEVIISGGFNSALIQKKNSDDLDFSSVLFLTLFVSSLFYFALFFAADWIASTYRRDLLVPVIRVMGLVLFINAYKSVLCALISSRLEFKKFFMSTIGGTVISAILGIALALKGFGPWALVAQEISNSFIDTLILSISTRYKPLMKCSFKRLNSLFRFGGKIYLSSIITALYEQIKPLIVGLKFSATDLAYYNKGESFPMLLNSSITDTFSSVLFPVISKLQDDLDEVRNATRRFLRVSSYVIFPMMIGLFVIADNLVIVLLTAKWLPIVPYIRIFCFSYMLNIVQIGNLQAIKAIGRSDIILRLEIIKKVSYLVIILMFVLVSDSPVILAMSTVVTTVVASLVNTFPNRKLIGYRYKQQIMDLLPNLLSSLIMGAAVFGIGRISIDGFAIIALQILTGIVVYVVISIISRNRELNYVLDIMRDIFNR